MRRAAEQQSSEKKWNIPHISIPYGTVPVSVYSVLFLDLFLSSNTN